MNDEDLYAPPTEEELNEEMTEEELYAPEKSKLKKAAEYGAYAVPAAVRGVTRAYNPLPLIGISQEETEAASGLIPELPWILKEEAKRGYGSVVENQPYQSAVKEAYGKNLESAEMLTKTLSEKAPGVEQGAELGAIAGEATKFGIMGLQKGFRWLMERSLPEAEVALTRIEREIGQRSANMLTPETMKIIRHRDKARKLTKQLLHSDNEELLRAVYQEPEAVRELVQFGGDLNPDYLAVRLADALEANQKRLGVRVGRFRKRAAVDDRELIDPRRALDAVMEARKYIKGELTLDARDAERLNKIERWLMPRPQSTVEFAEGFRPDKVPVRDALEVVDTIDQMDLSKLIDKGGNVSRRVGMALMKARRILKPQIRATSPKAEQWAKADDAYSQFMEHAGGLILKFRGPGRVSQINNLLGMNKTPIREDVTKAFAAAGRSADAFFNELNNLKAAQGFRAVQYQKNDPIQDRIRSMSSRWIAFGAGAGATAFGYLADALQMGVGYAGSFGATLGGAAFLPIAAKMGDPMRILKAAQKAKGVSVGARALARDLSWVDSKFGVEGVEAFLRIIPASNAARDLVDYLAEYMAKNVEPEKDASGAYKVDLGGTPSATEHYVLMQQDPKYRAKWEKRNNKEERR